jgi:NADH-quinone oxidoreductase subunit J
MVLLSAHVAMLVVWIAETVLLVSRLAPEFLDGVAFVPMADITVVAGVVVFEIVSVVWTRGSGAEVDAVVKASPAGYSNTAELGKLLYTEYVYPFELAAVLLLVAIVAAISLTMRKRAGLKLQDISMQVAVRSQDRVRIIKMAAEGTGANAPQSKSPEKDS